MEKVNDNVYRGMKVKTINAVLKSKFNDWLASITDERVKNLAAKNTIITGGSIASMLRGEKVNDFDMYFRDYETTYAVAQYYLSLFKPVNKKGIACKIFLADGKGHPVNAYESSRGESSSESSQGRIKIIIKSAGIASAEGTEKPYEYFEGRPPEEGRGYVEDIMGVTETGQISDDYEEVEEKAQDTEDEAIDAGPKYRPVFMSTNAITLSNRVQLVIRFWGSPDKIHENYDFVHCTNYWTSWEGKVVLRKEALEAIMAKELRYVGSRYPICSLIRLRKFIRRGWTITAGQILKMVMQVQQLDLKSLSVLEDQLTGVDTAYFAQVLSALKSKGDTVDSTYLMEIIDRMF